MKRILPTNSYWRGRRDEEPHRCNQCSYVGINSDLLSRHIFRMHTDEKPFKCDICSYADNVRSQRYNNRELFQKKKHALSIKTIPMIPDKVVNNSISDNIQRTIYSTNPHHLQTKPALHTDENPYRNKMSFHSGTSNSYFQTHIGEVTDSTQRYNNKGLFRAPSHQPPVKIVSSTHQKENGNCIANNIRNEASDIKGCVEFSLNVMERNLMQTIVRAHEESEEWKNIISMIMT
ncbi:zinc finger protein 83 [Ditylenchus destructor]|nr:zinc finger protein 83 [Ditylenchus destructor]